jgi:hypothetical protein
VVGQGRRHKDAIKARLWQEDGHSHYGRREREKMREGERGKGGGREGGEGDGRRDEEEGTRGSAEAGRAASWAEMEEERERQRGALDALGERPAEEMLSYRFMNSNQGPGSPSMY